MFLKHLKDKMGKLCESFETDLKTRCCVHVSSYQMNEFLSCSKIRMDKDRSRKNKLFNKKVILVSCETGICLEKLKVLTFGVFQFMH